MNTYYLLLLLLSIIFYIQTSWAQTCAPGYVAGPGGCLTGYSSNLKTYKCRNADFTYDYSVITASTAPATCPGGYTVEYEISITNSRIVSIAHCQVNEQSVARSFMVIGNGEGTPSCPVGEQMLADGPLDYVNYPQYRYLIIETCTNGFGKHITTMGILPTESMCGADLYQRSVYDMGLLYSCPAICQNGGTCNNGICTCTLQWTGTDCTTDVNECLTLNGGCNQTCTNTQGGRTCSCGAGYTTSDGGVTCDDVNECLTANGGCSQTCTNIPGGRTCSCLAGYSTSDNGLTCNDVNECLNANGGCPQECENTPGSHTCHCFPGYTSPDNGLTCNDVDECLVNNGGCEYTCNNTAGDYECSCPPGTVLSPDGLHCQLPPPFIQSTTPVFINGGVLTINGTYLGSTYSTISINLGRYHCTNIQIITEHTQLTCKLPSNLIPSTEFFQVQVNQSVSNDYYITIEDLTEPECPENCNGGNGECTKLGCQCKVPWTGPSCKEEVIDTNPNPTNPTQPEITTDYKISIIAIQELDIEDTVTENHNLTAIGWSMTLNDTLNGHWTYNVSLGSNHSTLTATYDYIKEQGGRNYTFSGQQFTLNQYSLKLSMSVHNWPFKSKMNSVRVLIKVESQNTDPCASSSPPPTTQPTPSSISTLVHNALSGMSSRFLSIAQVDDRNIIGRVNQVSIDDYSVVIGTSLPYFNHYGAIDPDFSIFLRVDDGTTSNNDKCGDSKNDNWKIIVGVVIGGVGAAAIVTGSVMLIKKKRNTSIQKKEMNRKLQKLNS
ncbi:hypothetical protein DFA_02077 [Cavenderia fasciculata]|uniref:EGF-like domain-containing protein n=1 Tax=Cavenderia fasciculata TaxID=261658 RepID=F4PYM4_CACFS|nr:uncharacterized protein DFA_02077 [Cavenderia fasciculata]EGG19290.1 hypothetical protein DFA_02077 [Cavenderia fasciculata]|eukprot:XP_004357561.1 hypothetical protein DFA_02077 [Cavenderia fasciculata]